MQVDINHLVIAISASLKFFQLQTVSGQLILLDDRIIFKSLETMQIGNIKETFLFTDIKSLKTGFSLSPFRITIMDHDGETWIFDQVHRKDAKKFVELYHAIT
ncbi:hypothetical protein [Staphylococcus saprophyticus]|uniref:hypothetical protein n=1 Tax=Staphylococcus saprophyticus TaxID=29385 RepID=UPI001E4140D3|nr:hypothetical protein [Staphylococcus saprophyticus]MCD9065255.1 hypothetical protein [Staphylococcus saprophyticus]